MDREVVRFETGKPQTLALEFLEGKLCPGKEKYGRLMDDQYQWTLCGNKIAWVSPLLEEYRKSLQLKRGEEFVVTRTNRRGEAEDWKVSRATDPGATIEPLNPTPQYRKLLASLELVNARKAALETPPSPIHAVSNTTNTPQRSKPLIHSAMIAAVDALMTAQGYARAQGMELAISMEDVRACAATLYIQHAGKERAS